MPERPSELIPEDADLEAAGRRTLQDASKIIGGRATTTYMRNFSGTNVGPNRQTGPGSLRKQTGRLARSLIGKRSAQPTAGSIRNAPEGIFDLSPTKQGVKLTYGSKVPYAGVHEEGFSGRQAVSTHQRTMTQGFGPESAYPQTVQVSAHTRQVDFPARPYLEPALDDSLGEITDVLEREVLKEILEAD